MSAREWMHCPFCKKDFDKAKEQYGKIPMEEFLKKLEKWDMKDMCEDEPYETVRMDGEEWLDEDGEYKVEHYLECNKCYRTWEVKKSAKSVEYKN